MSSSITQQQLESYLWGAATLLRGTIYAGDYKQFIFPLLFFKRLCDVYDEEYQRALKESGGDVDFATFAENHRFQMPTGARWLDVRNRPKNVGKGIQDAMRDIEKSNPDTLFGIFGDAQWTNTSRRTSAPGPRRRTRPGNPQSTRGSCQGTVDSSGRWPATACGPSSACPDTSPGVLGRRSRSAAWT
jgi:type I restriction-modification system DNA methylase subunit